MQPRSTKRQRELSRQQHKQEKAVKRDQRKREKDERPARLPGEADPQIAGIIPGPQPVLEY